MNDKMREEFEAWASEEAEVRGVGELIGLLKDEHHDRYAMIWTQTAWVAWQASRTALVVELPQEGAARYWEEFEDVEGQCFNWAKYNRHVKEALAIAGLKVKP